MGNPAEKNDRTPNKTKSVQKLTLFIEPTAKLPVFGISGSAILSTAAATPAGFGRDARGQKFSGNIRRVGGAGFERATCLNGAFMFPDIAELWQWVLVSRETSGKGNGVAKGLDDVLLVEAFAAREKSELIAFGFGSFQERDMEGERVVFGNG